jgi:hypothetical protein
LRFTCALLCDAATVREGLLHILGGGVSRSERPSFPTPLGLTLALELAGPQEEVTGQHEVNARLVKVPSGDGVGHLKVTYEAAPLQGVDPEEDGSLSLALPLLFDVSEPGMYRVDIDVDDGAVSASTADLKLLEASPSEPPDAG